MFAKKLLLILATSTALTVGNTSAETNDIAPSAVTAPAELATTQSNPAASFCIQQGEYDLETGDCILHDQTRINAWEHFRNQNDDNERLGRANPAAAFCDLTGTYDDVTEKCTLEDGTQVEAWVHFRNAHELPSQPLELDHDEIPQAPEAVDSQEIPACNDKGQYDLGVRQCFLEDGTVVDAWERYSDEQNKQP